MNTTSEANAGTGKQTPGPAHQETQPAQALPPIGAISVAGFWWALAAIAVELIARKPMTAVAAAAGALNCILMLALLRAFAVRAIGLIAGSGKSSGLEANAAFALFSVGKFIILGIALYVTIAVLKLNVLGFSIGFVLTQAGALIFVWRRLNARQA